MIYGVIGLGFHKCFHSARDIVLNLDKPDLKQFHIQMYLGKTRLIIAELSLSTARPKAQLEPQSPTEERDDFVLGRLLQ